jgi:hypothetical protein
VKVTNKSIDDLCNDAVSSSDNAVSNVKMSVLESKTRSKRNT